MVRRMPGIMGLLNFGKQKRVKINEDIPVNETSYVVIDTELTGLDEKKDSIVSMAAIKMEGGRIDLNNTFYRLVNPEAALTAKSVVIHEITPSDVIQKPDIDTVLSEFLEFCGNAVVVGHCVSIDFGFIDREMKKKFGYPLRNRSIDTFVIYRWLAKRAADRSEFSTTLRDFKLYPMARAFGVPVSGAHNAMMDAFITAQLFQRFIPILDACGIKKIGDLLRAGDPFKGGEAYRSAGKR